MRHHRTILYLTASYLPARHARNRSPSFRSLVLMTAGVGGRRRGGVRIGITARARGIEPLEIFVPHRIVPRPELVEIVPGVDAGVVSVRELGTNRVVPDRFDLRDGDFAFAHLQRFLAGSVAAHVGGWRINSEEFVRKPKTRAVDKRKLHHARGLMELDFGWNRSV